MDISSWMLLRVGEGVLDLLLLPRLMMWLLMLLLWLLALLWWLPLFWLLVLAVGGEQLDENEVNPSPPSRSSNPSGCTPDNEGGGDPFVFNAIEYVLNVDVYILLACLVDTVM